MKGAYSIALALALTVVACSKKEETNQGQNQQMNQYCLQQGYQDPRCPGLYGYNQQYYWGQNQGGYQTWAPYNTYGYQGQNYYAPYYWGGQGYSNPYSYGGCSYGYAPVTLQYGLACYYVGGGGYGGYGYGYNPNQYYWYNYGGGYQYGGGYPGFLQGCGVDYTGTCPSGYSCSQNGGLGVCVR